MTSGFPVLMTFHPAARTKCIVSVHMRADFPDPVLPTTSECGTDESNR